MAYSPGCEFQPNVDATYYEASDTPQKYGIDTSTSQFYSLPASTKAAFLKSATVASSLTPISSSTSTATPKKAVANANGTVSVSTSILLII